MGVQAELLRIGTMIADQEPVILSGAGTREMLLKWANVREFLPGLAITATFGGAKKLDITAIDIIQFSVLEDSDGVESRLAVPTDMRHADEFEDEYSQYFLEHFRAYETRPNPLVPVGIVGLEQEVAVAEHRLHVPPYWD